MLLNKEAKENIKILELVSPNSSLATKFSILELIYEFISNA